MFIFVITSCSHQISLIYGEIVHGMVAKSGFESNLDVGTSGMKMYYVFARMEGAHNFSIKCLSRMLLVGLVY